MKKLFSTLAVSLFMFCAYAGVEPYFSGYTGFLGKLNNDRESSDLDLEFSNDIFFAGQLDFASKFFCRGEIAVQTNDIVETGLFSNTGAHFRINEISFTYHMMSLSTTHFFSLFLGNFEPIGSDVFLQRQFGIQPISSPLAETYSGLSGSTIYPFYGAGGSYVIHFESPTALGIYLYANKDDATEENVFNTDLRLACARPYLSLDFTAGLAFPHEQSIGETGQKVVMLVRTVTLHAGLNFLAGNKNTFSFFTQAGFTNLYLNPQNDQKISISSDDISIFIEPRLLTQYFCLNLSIFSIPKKSCSNLVYVNDPLGVNLSLFTNKLHIQNKNITIGIHTVLSFPDRNFMDIVDAASDFSTILDWERNLYLMPYFAMPLFGGNLQATISANLFHIADQKFNAFNITLGYKTQI